MEESATKILGRGKFRNFPSIKEQFYDFGGKTIFSGFDESIVVFTGVYIQ